MLKNMNESGTNEIVDGLHAPLFELIRGELAAVLNGYMPLSRVMPPMLSARAGVLGALVLAEQAAAKTH